MHGIIFGQFDSLSQLWWDESQGTPGHLSPFNLPRF